MNKRLDGKVVTKISKEKNYCKAEEYHQKYFQKKITIKRQKFKTKKSPKVLYGGSVNDENISLFSLISEIDGFLIGGASQSSKKFIDIVKNYYK